MDERDAIIEEEALVEYRRVMTEQDLWGADQWTPDEEHVEIELQEEAAMRAAVRVVLAAERRRVTREIEALPGVGIGDHGESLPGGHLLPRHAVLGVVSRGVPEQEETT